MLGWERVSGGSLACTDFMTYEQQKAFNLKVRGKCSCLRDVVETRNRYYIQQRA